MSISDEINGLCTEGRLHRLVPALPGSRIRRALYVSQEINDLLLGPWADLTHEYRWNRARADLDSFVEHQRIVVPRDSRRARSAYMGQLQPPSNEVWEIRCRDPKPGIRILGRFAERDVFIALVWKERLQLHDLDSREWRDAILECKTKWQHLFHAYQPMTGNYPHEYISDAIFDRDS
jgi:hypothetical protein